MKAMVLRVKECLFISISPKIPRAKDMEEKSPEDFSRA
jgi:hypothetical protein